MSEVTDKAIAYGPIYLHVVEDVFIFLDKTLRKGASKEIKERLTHYCDILLHVFTKVSGLVSCSMSKLVRTLVSKIRSRNKRIINRYLAAPLKN